MTTLIAWGNSQDPFPFEQIPPELIPAHLHTDKHSNPRVQQRWQCRRLAHFLLWQLLKTSGKLLTIESSSIVRPIGAVGKANVQNPLDFVTTLLGQIPRTASGRPYFPEPHIDFNISHSGDWVAVILHINDHGEKSAVGIDIEFPRKARPYSALLAHFAHAQEIQWFRRQADEKTAFYRIWCTREAVLKSQGVGIAKLSEVIHQPDSLQLHSAYCPRGRLIFTRELPFYLAFFVNREKIQPHFFCWKNHRLETAPQFAETTAYWVNP